MELGGYHDKSSYSSTQDPSAILPKSRISQILLKKCRILKPPPGFDRSPRFYDLQYLERPNWKDTQKSSVTPKTRKKITDFIRRNICILSRTVACGVQFPALLSHCRGGVLQPSCTSGLNGRTEGVSGGARVPNLIGCGCHLARTARTVAAGTTFFCGTRTATTPNHHFQPT